MARPPDTSPAGRRIRRACAPSGPLLKLAHRQHQAVWAAHLPVCDGGAAAETAVLTWKEEQKTHTLYIPIAWRETVSAWVEEGKRLKALSPRDVGGPATVLIAQRGRARQ